MKKLDEEVINLWNKGYSATRIGKSYGVTRHAIYKYLHSNEIKLKDREVTRQRVNLTCKTCGIEYSMVKSRVGKWSNTYCSSGCFRKSQGSLEYNRNRQGQIIARKVINSVYPVVGGDYVIHHVDGDPMNNRIENLMIFLNQIDHRLWHDKGKLSGIEPLWRGDGVVEDKAGVLEAGSEKDSESGSESGSERRFIPPGLIGFY
jgi:predicted transcriptional regulator